MSQQVKALMPNIVNVSLSNIVGTYDVPNNVINTIFLITNSIAGSTTTITLNTNDIRPGNYYCFKKMDDTTQNMVKIQLSSSTTDPIDSNGNYVLTTQYQAVTIMMNTSSQWNVLNNEPPQNILVYSNSGTYSWRCPEGVTNIYVCVFGAGGGGGSVGPGGSGGGYAEGPLTVVPETTYSILVGAGGIGGSGGNSVTPGDGGDSTVGTITAHGGQAGSNVARTSGSGGTGVGGTINYKGGDAYNASGSNAQCGAGGAGFSGNGGDATDDSTHKTNECGNGSGDYAKTLTFPGDGSSINISYTFREGGSGGTSNSGTGNQGGFPGGGGGCCALSSNYGGPGSDGAVILMW